MADNENTILPLLPGDVDEILERESKIFLPGDDWMDIDISNDWLNPEDEWETAKNALYIGNAPVCVLGGLTLLSGQSGNGKTMTLAMMISAIFKGSYGKLNLGTMIENPTVLYVDTEMEKYNTQRQMNRIYSICYWEFRQPKEQFKILRLRDTDNVVERWKKTLKAIDMVKPTFCFLDGLIDIVADFNNNVECQSLIYKLMKAASWYDMAVIGIIHLNPGGEKMAGHLGSFGERKAVTVLNTRKEKNGEDVQFVVEQKKARDKDASSITFKVEDDKTHLGIPIPIQGSMNSNESMASSLEFILSGREMNTRDLRSAVMKRLGLREKEATDYINKAVDENILTVEEEWTKDLLNPKLKNRKYSFNPNHSTPF